MPVMRIVILLVAAGAAIAAALLVRGLQNAPVPVAPIQAPAAVAAAPARVEKEPEHRVLVAAIDVRVGQYVTEEMLAWQPWPDHATRTAFLSDDTHPEAMEKMIGAVLRSDMLAGEPFTPQKYAHPGTAGFMAALLTPGMRAVSIEINADSASGGFIYPNDRVDIVMTRKVPVATGGGISKQLAIDTILNNVRVLAIDGYYRPVGGEEGRALPSNRATLELTKEDALVLTAAVKKGSLSLVLRSIGEVDEPSGSTPRARQLAALRGPSAEGIRIFQWGYPGSLTSAPPGNDDIAQASPESAQVTEVGPPGIGNLPPEAY